VDSDCRDALPVLIEGAHHLGLELDEETRARFVSYCALLSEVNARMNLSALRTPAAMMSGLFLDSLTCVLALPETLRQHDRSPRVVDVGAGAGLPGVPLKLLFPEWRLTLVESIGKKARFLNELTQALALENVRVVAERAELLAVDPTHRDRADLCFARAVATLPTLIELCAPLVRPGGYFIFPKGRDAAMEVVAAEPAARALRAAWECTIALPPELSHLGEGRVLVRYRKTASTPRQFPRRVGLARSHPLTAATPTRGRQSRRG
jgi:16S rRNA (guanine527-N7)-methyltransferase